MRSDRVKLVTELAKRDMTQKRLAELSGVSRATINYIRSGKSCTDEVGQKIAKALGVDVAEILEDDATSQQEREQVMRLNSEKVKTLMGKRGLTKEMLVPICGIRHIEDNCFIAPAHAKRLALVLGVDVAEIVATPQQEGGNHGFTN